MFRQAKRALGFTSATSASTLLVNVFSPLMPIRSFSIFAFFVVVVNYYQVVYIFPSAIILYEEKFHNLLRCCRNKIHIAKLTGRDDDPIT